jgi:YihY family inner membrane protein
MSTASAVPETRDLKGDDARRILKRTGWWKLLKDSFTRFRTADGFTTSRAIAHASVLTAFPALITVIGAASVFHLGSFRNVLETTLERLAPGPSAELLRTSFHEGSRAGGTSALIGGLAGVLIAGTMAMSQVERGLNRVYGMVRDRGPWRKVLVAFALNVSAGVMLILAFAALAAGGPIGEGLKAIGWSSVASTIFAVLRWPLGLAIGFGALTLLYRVSPNRRQPAAAWLQTGTIMATVLWVIFTALLALFYATDRSLGSTYGPLVGIIALLTWAYLTAIALLLGMAFAAQLEAVRAGEPGPHTLRRHNETVQDPRETAGADVAAVPLGRWAGPESPAA